MPEALVQQLKPGGSKKLNMESTDDLGMVIPVGPAFLYQYLKCVDKSKTGKVSIHNITECRFVPLQHVS